MTIIVGTTVPSVDIHTKTKEGMIPLIPLNIAQGAKWFCFVFLVPLRLPVQQNICQDLLKNFIS